MGFHLGDVDADEFLVERYGQWRLAAELCHISPLLCLDGLFDGVDGILCEQFEFIESLVKRESSVGIDSQLDFVVGETFAYAFHHVELLFKLDGSNLQFYAVESLL